MIDNGLISVDEGVSLLKALDQRQAEPGAVSGSLEEPLMGSDLASKSEKVIFSAPPPAPQSASETVTSAEAGFEERSASQAGSATNFQEESHPGAEKVHAPEPEPPAARPVA